VTLPVIKGGPLSTESLVGWGMTGYACQYITPYHSNTHFNTTTTTTTTTTTHTHTMSRFLKWSLPFRLPKQNNVCILISSMQATCTVYLKLCPTPSWSITTFWLSAATFAVYLLLPNISGECIVAVQHDNV